VINNQPLDVMPREPKQCFL